MNPRSFERNTGIRNELPNPTTLKEQFDHVLRGKLDSIQDGNWEARISGLDQIHSIAIRRLKKDAATNTLAIVPVYSYLNRYNLDTVGSSVLKLDSEGNLEASNEDWELLEKRLSKNRNQLRSQLLSEVLTIIDTYKPEFWSERKNLNLPLKPEPNEPDGVEGGRGKSQRGEPAVDPKRLAYWPNCHDALFGAPTTTKGYWAVCFKNFVVYDHPVYPNAVVGHFFEDEWDVPADAYNVSAEYRMSDADRKAYEDKFLNFPQTTQEERNRMRDQGILVRRYHPEKALDQNEYNKKMDEIMNAFRAHAQRRAGARLEKQSAE